MAKILVSEHELKDLVRKSARELEPFFDLEYPIDVRLGSTQLTVGEILEMAPGDIVALERPSSGFVEIWISGVRVGEAEVLLRKRGTAARLVRLTS